MTEFMHATTTSQPLEVTVVDVLREHLAFAKEQLNNRQSWQDMAMTIAKDEIAQLKLLVGKLKRALTSLAIDHECNSDDVLDLIEAAP